MCGPDPAHPCPDGFDCIDGRCYRHGHGPIDMSVGGIGDDMATGGGDDMAGMVGNDLSGLPPPDLVTIPADLSGPFTWTTVSGITGNFRAGFALSRTNVFIVGDGNLVLHSNGDGVWSSPINTGITGGTWYAIWGDRSTGDLWLCGSNASTAVIVHTKDGMNWSPETQSTSVGSQCLALAGSSATDVYASGNGANGLLVHSTGTGVWGNPLGSVQPAPSPAHFFLGIGGSGATNMVFVGGPDVYRFTGGVGVIAREYQHAITSTVFHSVFAVSPVDIYVATDRGLFYSKGDGTWTGQMTSLTETLSENPFGEPA